MQPVKPLLDPLEGGREGEAEEPFGAVAEVDAGGNGHARLLEEPPGQEE